MATIAAHPQKQKGHPEDAPSLRICSPAYFNIPVCTEPCSWRWKMM